MDKDDFLFVELGIWELDLTADSLSWSDGIFDIFEIDKNRFGASYEAFLDLVHPEDRETVDNAYSRHLAERTPYQITHRLLMPDGRIKFVTEQCRSEFDQEGRPLRSIGTVCDVTERKGIEERLQQDREQQAALREMLEIALQGLSAEKALGLMLSRMLCVSWLSLLPRGAVFLLEGETLRLFASHNMDNEVLALCATVPAGRCLCGSAASSGQVVHSSRMDHLHEFTHEGMDDHGHYIVPLLSGGETLGVLTLYLPPGFRTGLHEEEFIHSASNIMAAFVARNRDEEALELYSLVYRKSSEAVIVTDSCNRIISVNPAFTAISGYSPEEVSGRDPGFMQSGRHDKTFYEEMWRCLAETGHWQGEVWDRRKSGEIYPKWLNISVLRNQEGAVQCHVAQFSDITEKKRKDELIWAQANFDPLTNLPNRRLLMDRLLLIMSASARGGWYGALMLLDLDQFKKLNDTMGHSMGDRMLVEVSRRLKDCMRGEDSVARLGGDEFVVVLGDLGSSLEEAVVQSEQVAEKIRTALSAPYLLGKTEYHTTTSIGITVFRGHLENVENLISHADIAMYQAKARGRNAVCFHDPEMQNALETRNEIENALRSALANRELEIHYQVQVNGQGKPIGAEALLRWQHPKLGRVSPAQFIPIAEETGLILPIGKWVIQEACSRLGKWKSDPGLLHLSLAVNVSARQFRDPTFPEQIAEAIGKNGIFPGKLKLELTESMVLDNVEHNIGKMNRLKEMGILFSMDDFGTGYSSLTYLKRLPIDQIKIDQSFVRDIIEDQNDAMIVQTIIAMSQSLGLDVIAEGVETEEQRKFLAQRGCLAYQGYLFGRPKAVEEFETMFGEMHGHVA